MGRVSRPQGLNGELRVQLFRPRRTLASGPAWKKSGGRIALVGESETATLIVDQVRWLDASNAVLRLDRCADRDQASRFVGAFVCIDPLAPPPALTDAADGLIGAEALEEGSGAKLGTVVDIRDNGAQPLLILDEDGDVMVPFVDALVGAVGRSQEGHATVEIRSLPGLLDANRSD